MPKHFHTIEIVVFGGLGAILWLHGLRFVGAKLGKSDNAAIAKTGRALAGVGTLGTGSQ